MESNINLALGPLIRANKSVIVLETGIKWLDPISPTNVKEHHSQSYFMTHC